MRVCNLGTDERMIYDWRHNRSGSFYKGLFDLMMLADEDNLERLAKAFPEPVAAFCRWKFEEGWFEKVEAKARLVIADKEESKMEVTMEQIDFDKQLGKSIFEIYDEDGKALCSGTYESCVIYAEKKGLTIVDTHFSDHN